MNSRLLKLAGSPEEQAKWKQAWANGGYLLRPLYALIEERIQELEKYTEADFEKANHYALLVYRDGKKHELEFLKGLLPEGAKP